MLNELQQHGLKMVNNDGYQIPRKWDSDVEKAHRKSASWAATKIIEREEGLTSIEATGNKKSRQLVVYRDAQEIALSCRYNRSPSELNGSRITPDSHSIPALEMTISTSEKYQSACNKVSSTLNKYANRFARFSNVPDALKVQNIYRPLRDALYEELVTLNKTPGFAKRLFMAAFGDADYYLVQGGSTTKLVGYNFKGSLNCSRVSHPSTIDTITTNGSKENDLTVHFCGGWQFRWKLIIKDSNIKAGSIGITLSIDGHPAIAYTEVMPEKYAPKQF